MANKRKKRQPLRDHLADEGRRWKRVSRDAGTFTAYAASFATEG